MTSTRSAAATGLPVQKPTFLDPEMLPDLYGMQVAGDCMAPEFPDAPESRYRSSSLMGSAMSS